MKTVITLLTIFLLLSGCVSPNTDSSSVAGNQGTPATTAQDVLSGENQSSERPYARELALEEEMILPLPSSSVTEPEAETNFDVQDSAVSIDLYNTFTLQLVAMETMEGAIDYARQYGIDSEKAGVARILSHGEIYFILAYGVYSTQTQAERASAELQQMGVPEPWIRRLGTIEQLSKAADELSPNP